MKTKTKLSRDELKTEYRKFLTNHRGLAESTIRDYSMFADRFLKYKFGETLGDLSTITAYDIANFLQDCIGHSSIYRDKTLSSYLRGFLRFLFHNELIEVNLALGVPSVKLKTSRRIPYHLNVEQIDELLAAVRNLPSCLSRKRNYAMVLLMARLGLRPPEVVRMQLDDIDWRKGEILIRGKGGYQDKLPLLEEIGEAIKDYIVNDRKGVSRQLFVAYRPPYLPFKSSQILTIVIKRAVKITSIPEPEPYTASHLLRHSLATNLVQKGASLEEICNALRHRNRRTTLLYARQNIDGLRTISLPWPIEEGGQS
ncbi:MAG: tyrosine-type recombinase/integrase [Bacteroidales bacterium]|nr:tyrosine-type recombinase/integrase [Bacteroidales bacterium]